MHGLREVRLKVYRTIIVPPLSSIKFVSWGQRKWREGEGVGWLVGWFVECRKKPGLEIAIFPFS